MSPDKPLERDRLVNIRPNAHSYDLPWREEPLSVHVLETDEATVLFGAGAEETADDLLGVAEDHDVDALVVEHGDADHYGGAPAIREALPNVEIAVPADDVPRLADAGVEVDRPLAIGEPYRGIETIAAPGHTPDNAAYLYEDVLVAGDTVVGADSAFVADGDWSGPLAVIRPDFNDDDRLARESVSELLAYDFDAVFVSHGPNVESGGLEAVETLVEDLR